MSINARAIATLGIGFGALAIASIGLNPGDIPIPPPLIPSRSSSRIPARHSGLKNPVEEDDALIFLLL